MAMVADGSAVRRRAWGARRAVRVMVCPWNPDASALLLFDRTGAGDVTPYPYTMKGEDVEGSDWEPVDFRET